MGDPESGTEPAPDDDPEPGERSAEDVGDAPAGDTGDTGNDAARDAGKQSREALRREVEKRYDFDDFGPADMAEMTGDEWEAVFDHDSWITGPELLDRVEADLRDRIARRDVFAVVERDEIDGNQRLVAYSDEGFALVYEDGSVEGSGTVLRDVKPTVALASMDSYEVPEPPAEAGTLPSPAEVPEGTGDLGNRLLEFVAAAQVVAALVLFVAWLWFRLSIVAPIVAVGFLLFGVFLFVVVANARLSDRFRAEEFRERLRNAGVESGERPPFVPGPDEPAGESELGTGAGAPERELGPGTSAVESAADEGTERP